jgi:hypothetical protein
VKIKADPVLASSIAEMATEVNRADTGRKNSRTAVMLPIKFANGWLFTKIKDDPVLSKGVTEIITPSQEAIRRPPLPKWQRCALTVDRCFDLRSGNGNAASIFSLKRYTLWNVHAIA